MKGFILKLFRQTAPAVLPTAETDYDQYRKSFKFQYEVINRDLEKNFTVLMLDYVTTVEELCATFKTKCTDVLYERLKEQLYETACSSIEMHFDKQKIA